MTSVAIRVTIQVRNLAEEERMIQEAMAEIEKVVLQESMKLPFRATANAPSTYKAVKAMFDSGITPNNPVLVYNGGSEDTIYSSPDLNFAFRAWHDRVHWENGLNFSVTDEIIVGMEQARKIDNNMGICIMFADTAGQRVYYHKYGEFVSNQREFNFSLAEKLYHRVVSKYGKNHRHFWSAMQSKLWELI